MKNEFEKDRFRERGIMMKKFISTPAVAALVWLCSPHAAREW
jgi:hypothetical protein